MQWMVLSCFLNFCFFKFLPIDILRFHRHSAFNYHPSITDKYFTAQSQLFLLKKIPAILEVNPKTHNLHKGLTFFLSVQNL